MTGLCGGGPGLDADAEIGSQDLACGHGKQPLLANGAGAGGGGKNFADVDGAEHGACTGRSWDGEIPPRQNPGGRRS